MTRSVKEPTWIKPAKGRAPQVQLADGRIIPAKQALSLAMWPAVRLRVVFDPIAGWFRSRDTPWHDRVHALTLKLIELAAPSFIVENIGDRASEPVLAPIAYTRAKASALARRTLFFAQTSSHLPWVIFRSGEAHSVTYERSLVVRNDSVSLFLPPTPQNAKRLATALDSLVGRGAVAFAFASVSFADAGWASMLAVDRASKRSPEGPRSNRLDKMESTAAVLGAPWLVWIGDRMRRVDASGKLLAGSERRVRDTPSLARIEVARPNSTDDDAGAKAARQLRADLDAALKKTRAKLTASILAGARRA